MQDVITGITENGERLHFTRQAFEAYRDDALHDAPRLAAALDRCVEFITYDQEDRYGKPQPTMQEHC